MLFSQENNWRLGGEKIVTDILSDELTGTYGFPVPRRNVSKHRHVLSNPLIGFTKIPVIFCLELNDYLHCFFISCMFKNIIGFLNSVKFKMMRYQFFCLELS